MTGDNDFQIRETMSSPPSPNPPISPNLRSPTRSAPHPLQIFSNLLFCQAAERAALGEAICKANACRRARQRRAGSGVPAEPTPPPPRAPSPALPQLGARAPGSGEPRPGEPASEVGAVLTEGAVLLLGAADLAVLLDLEKVLVVRVELPLAHVALEVIVAPHVSPRTGRRGEGRGEGGG